jgi:hypothetical protein
MKEIKVIDLKPGMEDVDLVVEIDYIPQNSWSIVFVKDETKDIKMIFSEEEIKKAKEGIKIKIKKGNVTLSRGQLQLNPHPDHPIEFLDSKE